MYRPLERERKLQHPVNEVHPVRQHSLPPPSGDRVPHRLWGKMLSTAKGEGTVSRMGGGRAASGSLWQQSGAHTEHPHRVASGKTFLFMSGGPRHAAVKRRMGDACSARPPPPRPSSGAAGTDWGSSQSLHSAGTAQGAPPLSIVYCPFCQLSTNNFMHWLPATIRLTGPSLYCIARWQAGDSCGLTN